MRIIRLTFLFITSSAIFIMLNSPAFGQSTEDLPLILGPGQLVEHCSEPERTMLLTTADMAREQQQQFLEQALAAGDDWQNDFIVGISFALEEYWCRELSYPSDCDKLQESGYLLPDWADHGFEISDFLGFEYDTGLRQLIYLPTPLGRTQIKRVPGRHCAFTRRCFFSYSLVVPEQAGEIWSAESSLETPWTEPFRNKGFIEILHLNKDNPGMSGCSLCD